MKPLFFTFLLLSILSCKSQENLPDIVSNLEKVSTQVGDDTRTYSIFIPSTITEGMPASGAVFLFHGSNGSGEQLSASTNMNSELEQENLIGVYPDAPIGNWAEDCSCNNADRLQINDTSFVRIMLDEIMESYTFSTDRVFAIGFSQGGLFTQRLACQMSDLFTAYGVVAANMSVPLAQKCSPKNPVSQIIIQGRLDTVLPYNGSNNGALSLVPTQQTLRFWAEQNECNLSNALVETDPEKELLSYCSEELSAQLTLVTSQNGGHGWFLPGVQTNKELINFFQQF